MRPGEPREAWLRAAQSKQGKPRPSFGKGAAKGIGPNKASGHKGGMGRQGSKRG